MPKYRVDLKLSDGTALNAGTMEVKDAYEYAKEGGYTGTEAQYKELLANAVDKRKISLGLHTDGLIYLFVDGSPVGNGIALPSGGVSGDVVGNVDSANNIVLNGNLADGTYTVKYEMEDGSTVNIGTMVLDSNVYYSVTKNLTNCSISNSATSVIEGESYSATISANSGYELKSVSVTMGGSAVSVTNGVINIASVTGNIVITAVAEETAVTPSYTNLFDASKATINSRYNSSGVLTTHDGYVAIQLADIANYIPFTNATKIYIKGATFQDDGKARMFTRKSQGTDGQNAYSVINKNGMTITDEGNGVESISGVANSFVNDVVCMVMCPKVSDTAITTDDIADIVITIDEPIN